MRQNAYSVLPDPLARFGRERTGKWKEEEKKRKGQRSGEEGKVNPGARILAIFCLYPVQQPGIHYQQPLVTCHHHPASVAI